MVQRYSIRYVRDASDMVMTELSDGDYVLYEDYERLDERIISLVGGILGVDQHPGTLNYAISKLLHEYIKREGLSYETINKIMGVLSCVQAELYRTVAGPYEEKKRIGNGPVSDLDAKSLEEVR